MSPLPTKPRDAKSAFDFYRDSLETDPDMSSMGLPDRVQEASQRWALLPSVERETYESMAKKDASDYRLALKAYNEIKVAEAHKSSPIKKKRQGKAKKRGAEKKKDPLAPKRGLSAYMFFCNAKREELKNSRPELSFSEVGKELGKMWSETKPSDKAEYVALAKVDKERYEGEMSKYVPPSDTGSNGKAKLGKKNGVKKNINAYTYFCLSKREEIVAANPSLSFGEVGKELGRSWKVLDEAEKSPFVQKAADDKARYLRELAEQNAPSEKKVQSSKLKVTPPCSRPDRRSCKNEVEAVAEKDDSDISTEDEIVENNIATTAASGPTTSDVAQNASRGPAAKPAKKRPPTTSSAGHAKRVRRKLF